MTLVVYSPPALRWNSLGAALGLAATLGAVFTSALECLGAASFSFGSFSLATSTGLVSASVTLLVSPASLSALVRILLVMISRLFSVNSKKANSALSPPRWTYGMMRVYPPMRDLKRGAILVNKCETSA